MASGGANPGWGITFLNANEDPSKHAYYIYMCTCIYIYIHLHNMYIPAISTDIHGWQITSYKFIDTLVKGYRSWLLNQGLQRMFQAQPAFSNIPSTMGTRTGSVHTLNSSSKPWSFYVENPCDRVGKIGNDQSVKMFLLVHLFILYPIICLFYLLLSRVLLGIIFQIHSTFCTGLHGWFNLA